MRKDKAKVIDEVWTVERVRSFMDLKAPAGINVDYHRLLRAYRSMRVKDFQIFLDFFIKAGCDINSKSPQGASVLELISTHRHSGPYVEAMISLGAKNGSQAKS